MAVFLTNDVTPAGGADTRIESGKIIPFHQLSRCCDVENPIAVARKFPRGFQHAPRPWMNVHWFMKRITVYARNLAFPIVKTHQPLDLLDGGKCRLDSTLHISSVESRRLNFHKRA